VLLSAVRRALEGCPVVRPGATLVAALSGGADSVALTDALVRVGKQRGFRVHAAHLDHGLRPGSAEDALFCERLCDRLGVRLTVGRVDVAARARLSRRGIEETARGERYAFLREVKRSERAVAIAVAHTRDDQAETLLMRLLRGSGSIGLGAMRPSAGDLLRPLLELPRAEVVRYLARRGLSWREDPSNADPAFARNRVRVELLPYLEARFNPRIREALARSASLLADEAALVTSLADELLARSGRRSPGAFALPLEALREAPPALARCAVRRALESEGGLRGVGFVHVERLLALAASPAPSGRRLALPGGGREALFRFDEVHIVSRAARRPAFSRCVAVPGAFTLPDGGRISLRSAGAARASNQQGAVVAVPRGPLELRTRQPGDRVLVGGRDVSLKHYFLERRVPADLRAGLPLVASGSRVLWIPGHPVDGWAGPGRRLIHVALLAPRRAPQNRMPDRTVASPGSWEGIPSLAALEA
jgi:tRNA(Ile)-lysidine synthase